MLDPGYFPPKEEVPTTLKKNPSKLDILENSYKPPVQEIPNILNPDIKIPFAPRAPIDQSYVVVLHNDKNNEDVTLGKFLVLVRLNEESFNIYTAEYFKTATIFTQDKKFIKELIGLAFPNKSFTFMNIEKND